MLVINVEKWDIFREIVNNRQKDLKRTYRKKHKDLQAVVTTTDPHITLQQPVIVTGSKVKSNPSILKVASGGQGKGPAGKVKGTKPLNKGRKMW